jgi:FhaA, N-terminal domain/FHA domain
MNPLRTLENMLAGLVEGTFGRVFRTEVRPMELAHKLAREMDENTTVSVSRTYAPNEYVVWLSPSDRARYEGVEDEVVDELCAYLLEHARGEDYALAARLHVSFETDERLRLGEFGIEARLAREQEPQARRGRPEREPPSPPAEEGESGGTMVFSGAARVREAVQSTSSARRSKAILVLDGRRMLIPARGGVVGRSRQCDVVIDDSGVSRRHAELSPGAEGWRIEDLGSTNGVRVNGSAVRGSRVLEQGDRIEMGSTEMLFEIS